MKKKDLIAHLPEIHAAIPAIACIPGCLDCCCPVPFSRYEWSRVPMEFKRGLDIRVVRGFGGYVWMPFRPGWLPANLKDVGEATGELMRAGRQDEEAGSCPFADPARGCLIYDHRPLLCRFFGVVAHPLMICKHGIVPEKHIEHESAWGILGALCE